MSDANLAQPSALPALERLERRLESAAIDAAERALLEVVGAVAQALDAAWSRCQLAFTDLGDLKAQHARLEGEERTALEDAVERVQRLHAVATACITRVRDEVVSRIEHTATGKQAMGGYDGSEKRGRSFDVEG